MKKQPEAEAAEPKPDESALRPEGSEDGGAEVGVARRTIDGKSVYQQYHMQRAAGGALERIYHDTPDGFAMDKDGRLTPTAAKETPMLIGEPLKRRHALLLFSPQPVKGTPVVAATPVGICNPTFTMNGDLRDFYGLGSHSALFFQPGEAITRISIALTALQTAAFLLRAKRTGGTLPWNTIALGVVDDAAVGHAWSLPDTKIGSFRISAEAGGVVTATVDLISIGVMTEPTTLVTSNLTIKPLMWYEGVVTKGGAAWESRSLELNVNHNLDPKHVLYGAAPTTNKRAPKYLAEGNEVIDFSTQRYARTAISMQADVLAEFAMSAVFADIAGGATNTVTVDITAAKYGEEAKEVGDDIVYTARGRAKTFNLTQLP